MVGKILENINDELVIVPLAKFDIRSSNITHKIYNELGLHFLDSIYEYDYDPLDEYDYLTIEEYSNFPSIGFHGTSSKYLTSILRLGIRYNSGNTNWENVVKNDTHKHIIFFSTKSETPLFHANTLIKKQSDGSIPIIIKFEIPSKKLVVHDYDIERDVNSDKYKPIYVKSKSPKKKTFTNNPMTQSLHVGIYGYLGNIPPKFITGVAIPKFPNSDKQFEKDDFIMLEPREALKKLNLYY
jgi:hypothetical protein